MSDFEHELLNDVEAARYLKTTPRHLRRFREQGLACVYIGSKVRYRRADLDRFIEAAAASQSPVRRSHTV